MFAKKIFTAILLTIAIGLSAQEIDMFTAEMITIKENYVTQQSELDKQRSAELSKLISSCLTQAEQQEKNQKRRGNISAMAAAQKMVRQLKKYQEKLNEKGDFEPSSKSRRETKAISKQMATGKLIIDNKYAELQKEMLTKNKDTFKTTAMMQHNLPSVSQEKVDAGFEKLTKTKAPKDIPQVETNDVSSAKAPVDSMFSDYLTQQKSDTKQSGEAPAWQSFATIKGAVNNIEIFNIPLAEIADTKIFEGTTDGNTYKLEYTPIDKLNTENEIFFMVKNINQTEKFEVLNWPSERNNWNLVIRLKPTKVSPSNHRLELLIGGEFLNAQTNQVATRKLAYVKIQVKSVPDKAYVFLDDKPLKISGRYALTPCILTLPSDGAHILSIKKHGYKTKIVDKFTPEHKKVYSYVLIKSKNMNESTIKFDAKKLDWKSSKVSVNKDDKILIQTKGKWSVGKDQEQTDYKGYPNNNDYFKYYIEDKYSPSITKEANYGAMIVKIGKKGKPFAVTTGKTIVANQSGILYFTVNELDANRTDNTGSIYIKTQINPE